MILSSARLGPFVSATSNRVYQLGQRFNAEEEQYGAEGNTTQKKKARALGPRVARSTLTLLDLIDAGILAPGRNKIKVVYKGVTYTASLSKEGFIIWEGQKFNSATAFSIHCKRQQMPSKQGDDGWKSVLYEGLPLETFRRKFLALGQDKAAEQPIGNLDKEDLQPEGQQEGAGAEPAAQGTDQWVQCDRCKTWRIVPDSDWGAVQEDEREEWLCEYATWDLTDHTPFTAACKFDGDAESEQMDVDNEVDKAAEDEEDEEDDAQAEQEDEEGENGGQAEADSEDGDESGSDH